MCVEDTDHHLTKGGIVAIVVGGIVTAVGVLALGYWAILEIGRGIGGSTK